MGSYHKDGSSFRYQFVDHIGKIRKLNFGRTRLSKREQGYLDSNITHLVSCRKTGSLIDPKVQQWLVDIRGSKVAKKLAGWGLIAETGVSTLSEYLKWYFDQKLNHWLNSEGKPQWTPSTERANISTRNYLEQFLGKNRDIHTVTRGDAEDWLQWLRSEATRSNRPAAVSKHIKRARGWFAYAYRKQWIRENRLTTWFVTTTWTGNASFT